MQDTKMYKFVDDNFYINITCYLKFIYKPAVVSRDMKGERELINSEQSIFLVKRAYIKNVICYRIF